MLIDTHTHLYLEQFDEDRDAVIQRAVNQGVEKFFLPNIDSSHIQSLFTLAQDYPNRCYPMMGLHPGSVDENYEAELKEIETTIEQNEIYAIGEIGIDLYWDDTYEEQQKKAFRQQIQWAKQLELPIVIHCRAAFEEVLTILEQENVDDLFGIFHCFTADKAGGERIINLGGFYLGIGGIATFKNADLDKAVQQLPLEKMVLETDSPYLAPSPKRGKRNESSFLPYIARKVAELQDTSFEQVVEITTQNAHSVFRY